MGRAWADPTLPPWVATMCLWHTQITSPRLRNPPLRSQRKGTEAHGGGDRGEACGSEVCGRRCGRRSQAGGKTQGSWCKRRSGLRALHGCPGAPPTPTAQQRCTARMHVLARRRSLLSNPPRRRCPVALSVHAQICLCRAPCAQPNMASMTIHFDSKHPKEDWTVWCARPPCSINPNNTCMRSAPPHRRERRPLHRL